MKLDLSIYAQVLIASARELKKGAPELFRSIFITEDTSHTIARPVRGKFGWCVLEMDTSAFNLPKLKQFYVLLYHYGFIDSTPEKFEEMFIGDSASNRKEIWQGELMILLLLFYKLIYEEGVIPKPNGSFYDALAAHWEHLNKRTGKIKKLERRNVISSLSKARSNAEVNDIVENLIDMLMS